MLIKNVINHSFQKFIRFYRKAILLQKKFSKFLNKIKRKSLIILQKNSNLKFKFLTITLKVIFYKIALILVIILDKIS